MKTTKVTPFNYGIIQINSDSCKHIYTLLDNKYRKTKYVLIEKTIYPDNSEGTIRAIYSNSLEDLSNKLNIYPSWYNYPMGLYKQLQGDILPLS